MVMLSPTAQLAPRAAVGHSVLNIWHSALPATQPWGNRGAPVSMAQSARRQTILKGLGRLLVQDSREERTFRVWLQSLLRDQVALRSLAEGLRDGKPLTVRSHMPHANLHQLFPHARLPWPSSGHSTVAAACAWPAGAAQNLATLTHTALSFSSCVA